MESSQYTLNIHYTKCARIYSSLKRAFEGDSADEITDNQTTEEANLLFNERYKTCLLKIRFTIFYNIKFHMA